MGRRRGQTGAGGAVVSSLSSNSGGTVKSKTGKKQQNSESAGDVEFAAEGSSANRRSKKGVAVQYSQGSSSADVAGGSAEPAAGTVRNAGWIGKTPILFLREWCTRNDRKRPFFVPVGGMQAEEGFFRCIIPAGKRSGPTKSSGFEQVVGVGEAPGEEYAALNVLHQVEHGKPLERLLAPEYRAIWIDMDRRFADAEKAKAKAVFLAEKKRKEADRRAKQAKNVESGIISIPVTSRQAIEDALLNQNTSSLIDPIVDSRSGPSSVICSGPSSNDSIRSNLIALGFAATDADLASTKFDEMDKALDYLCLNLDESELPTGFAPAADVELVQFLQADDPVFGRRVNIQLAQFLSRAICCSRFAAEQALRASSNNALEALSSLFSSLTGISIASSSTNENARAVSETERQLEGEALEAIYNKDVKIGVGALPEFPDAWSAVVTVTNGLPAVDTNKPINLCFVDVNGLYPFSLPAFYVASDDMDLSSSKRRALIRAGSSRMVSVAGTDEAEIPGPCAVIYAVVSFLVEASESDLQRAAQASCKPTVGGSAAEGGRTNAVVSNSKVRSNPAQAPSSTFEKYGYLESATPVNLPTLRKQSNPRPLSNHSNSRQRAGLDAMNSIRAALPAYQQRERIIELVRKHQVTVISGATGSGKTTQIPQYILEDASAFGQPVYIVCTQPRRIAAMSVAKRVAEERCEVIGQSVGYQVKLNLKRSKETRLMFCTTGVLLRQMQYDPMLNGLTHIIVDECHERSVETDFALLLIRDILQQRPTLRVILMSATVDASKFGEYFSSTSRQTTPIICIPGRTFPVEEKYLEDAVRVAQYVISPGNRYARKLKRRTDGESSAESGVSSLQKTKTSQFASHIVDADDVEADEPDNLGELEESSDTGYHEAGDKPLSPSSQVHFAMRNSPSAAAKDSETNFAEVANLIEDSMVNMDLIDMLVRRLDRDMNDQSAGAILVFLPGMAEISTLVERLSRGSDCTRLHVMALHSALSPEDQSSVFNKAPKGRRKVICSTNIAETSVTVQDVTVVIDTLRVKEMNYDAVNGSSVLTETFISQASAQQRAGRAGRVSRGVCYRLVRRETFEKTLAKHQIPEIRRVSLEHLVLNVLSIIPTGSQPRDPHELLSKAVDPPAPEAITVAVESLIAIGALEKEGTVTDDRSDFVVPAQKTNSTVTLTPLGQHLSGLPVDARIGKLLIFGCVFGCMDAALTIAACMSEQSPFVSSRQTREPARLARVKFAWGKSDLLLFVKAYDSWRAVCESGAGYKAQTEFCANHYLSRKSLQAISDSRKQLAQALEDVGFDCNGPRTSVNVHSDNVRVVKAVLCGALYPNIVRIDPPATRYREVASGAIAKLPEARELRLRTKTGERVFIHPESVNFFERSYESRWLAYFSKVRTSRLYLRDTTMVSPLSILLFGGNIEVLHAKEQLAVDGWVIFKSPARVAVLVRELRKSLDRLLLRKFEHPGVDLSVEGRGVNEAILLLIKTEF